jgi:hypothetical protein
VHKPSVKRAHRRSLFGNPATPRPRHSSDELGKIGALEAGLRHTASRTGRGPKKKCTATIAVFENCVLLLVEEKSEEPLMHPQVAVIVDESHFAESVHEVTHSGTSGADHFCKCFLAHFQEDRLWP